MKIHYHRMLSPLTWIPILFGICSSTHAQDFGSARILALGGSGHAAPWLNDAIFMNPSYASFNPVYILSTSYLWADQGRNYSVSLQDSRNELFHAGAAFTRREGLAVVNIGASRLAIENLGFGLGAKFWIPDQLDTEPDFLFSSTFAFSKTFSAALIVDNILENAFGKSVGSVRTFTLGLRYLAFDAVSFYLDPHYTPGWNAGKKSGFSAGIEAAALADLYFRAGKSMNGGIPYLNDRGDAFGLGVGWVAPRLSLDYGFHRVTSSDAGFGISTAHVATMSVYF